MDKNFVITIRPGWRFLILFSLFTGAAVELIVGIPWYLALMAEQPPRPDSGQVTSFPPAAAFINALFVSIPAAIIAFAAGIPSEAGEVAVRPPIL